MEMDEWNVGGLVMDLAKIASEDGTSTPTEEDPGTILTAPTQKHAGKILPAPS